MRRILLLVSLGLFPFGLLADQAVRIEKKPAPAYEELSAATVATLAARGVTVWDDYGPFATGIATPAANLSTASAATGLAIGNDADAFSFDVAGLRIDIQAPDQALSQSPSDLWITDYSGSIGLYVVKFRGPTRPGWLDLLVANGARVIQYLHRDAFIIAAPTGIAHLQALVGGPLAYVGVYQPWFKLSSNMRFDSALTSAAPTRVQAILDSGQDLTDLVSQIQSVDPAAHVSLPTRGDASVSLVATPAQWRTLARQPGVVFLEPSYEAGPSDERIDQVIAKRRDANGVPTNPTQYKGWLASQCGGDCGNLAGEIVDVMDSGISTSVYHPDLPASRIAGSRLYLGISNLDDGYYHGTLVAGLLGGDPSPGGGTERFDTSGFYYDMGVAPTVRFHLSRIVTDQGGIPDPGMTVTLADDILRNAYNDGARFQNLSSNEYTNHYTALSREYDFLVRDATRSGTPDKEITVAVSAGNYFSGSDTFVWAPATAKNVISVGMSGIRRGQGFGGPMGASCDSTLGIKDIQSQQWATRFRLYERRLDDTASGVRRALRARNRNEFRGASCNGCGCHHEEEDCTRHEFRDFKCHTRTDQGSPYWNRGKRLWWLQLPVEPNKRLGTGVPFIMGTLGPFEPPRRSGCEELRR
jgi:hypothetical protein